MGFLSSRWLDSIPARLAGGAGSGRGRGRTVQQVRGRAELSCRGPSRDKHLARARRVHLIFDHGLEIMFGFFEKRKIFLVFQNWLVRESRYHFIFSATASLLILAHL